MKTYRRVLSYARPYLGQVGLYTLFTIISVIFAGLTFVMLQPLLEQLFGQNIGITKITNPGFGLGIGSFMKWISYQAAMLNKENKPETALLYVAMIIVGLNLISNLGKFMSNYYLGTVRTRVIEDLRRDVFTRLTALHVRYHESGRKGDIMSRITSDVMEVEYSVVVTFETIIRDPVSVIYYLSLMLMFSVKLTMFIFIVLPVAAWIISVVTRQLKRDAVQTQQTFGQIMSISDETISGIRIIKAFRAEGYIRDIFDRFNRLYSSLSRRQWHRKALVPIFSETAMVFIVGLIIWYGGSLVYKGEIVNASGFITYIGLFFLISRPAKTLSTSFSNIHKGIASAERIFSLMDTPPEIKDSEGSKSHSLSFEKDIVLQNVEFAYNTENVLSDINLRFEKGKIYALVGPSGSGKSTLAELLLRFYDVTSGSIRIDGTDIREVQQSQLRDLMAVVTQEPILFNDTIFNNIAFGMKNVTEDQVVKAAIAAHAHDFIMETEKGYQTNVGDRGGLLSGGQRQRISIARAILKNPPILILDEATSSLDTASEKVVQEALYELMENRTSIVIAHRLSTIQSADEIIVLEKGRIAERGTHTQLLEMKGVYYSLNKLQSVN